MQVTINGQHVESTDTLLEYVRRKLTRIDRHFGSVIRSYVVLHVTRNRHRVETTAHTKGTEWHAITEDTDMYVAIDRVINKLDRQASKYKGKAVDHHQEKCGLQSRPNP